MSTLNINQFAQVPILGQLDLQIARSGVISGMVSANQSGFIQAGEPVKLDSSVTVVGAPQFLSAASTDTEIGFMIYDVKANEVATPGIIQVAFFGGPVMWMTAGATIMPGQAVESQAANNLQVEPLAGGKQRGIALDYGASGQLLRVIILNSLL